MDGAVISHGNKQKYIWAYASGYGKVMANHGRYNSTYCPCTNPGFTGTVPPFIGNDYYCDSTTPLWTGEGCAPPNFCCSHSGMPWFCKTLPLPTTDYIEIRNCHNQVASNENTALDLIELYIH